MLTRVAPPLTETSVSLPSNIRENLTNVLAQCARLLQPPVYWNVFTYVCVKSNFHTTKPNDDNTTTTTSTTQQRAWAATMAKNENSPFAPDTSFAVRNRIAIFTFREYAHFPKKNHYRRRNPFNIRGVSFFAFFRPHFSDFPSRFSLFFILAPLCVVVAVFEFTRVCIMCWGVFEC